MTMEMAVADIKFSRGTYIYDKDTMVFSKVHVDIFGYFGMRLLLLLESISWDFD